MRLNCIGSEHKHKVHDLVGGSIDLARVLGSSLWNGRSVAIKDSGLDYVAVTWIQECNLGKGNYEITLELTHADIARLFLEAFGGAPCSAVVQELAQAGSARGGGD